MSFAPNPYQPSHPHQPQQPQQLSAMDDDHADHAENESVTDGAPSLSLHTKYIEIASLTPQLKARLAEHIRELDRSKQQAGFPATLDVEYAVEALDNSANHFVLIQTQATGAADKEYVGFIVGGYRSHQPDKLTVHLDAVLARLGRGTGLINGLLFAELDELRALYSGLMVTFKLKSVFKRVPTYEKLKFLIASATGQASQRDLTPMRTRPKLFPRHSNAPSAAVSSSAAVFASRASPVAASSVAAAADAAAAPPDQFADAIIPSELSASSRAVYDTAVGWCKDNECDGNGRFPTFPALLWTAREL